VTHRTAAATLACLAVAFVVLCTSRVHAASLLEELAQPEGESTEARAEERKWGVTLFGGALTKGSTKAVTHFSAEYEDSQIGVAALSYKFGEITRHLWFEVEGQVGKHFGIQDHWELNALIMARWVTFPWNRYLVTSVAVGDGISYATEVPKLEDKPDASQWLNYLLFEFTFALPSHPEWALVTRLHHRSGFYRALAPNSINAVGFGIKYRF
jgi:hypothetical protein